MLCKNPFMNGSLPCPCGQCMPCRFNRRRVWTHRIMLESLMYQDKCFLTLTYDAEHLPSGGTLVPRDYQLFMHRLRTDVKRKGISQVPLRFFMCGEYGDISMRPHYHFALFGVRCLTKIQYPQSGVRCFCRNCEFVRVVWGKGNVVLEDLTRSSAQYVAGYVVKKMTSKDDFRLSGRWPEFSRMSNRPGIGASAIDLISKGLISPYGEIFLSPEGDVPGVLKHANKALPMGRYLVNKLRQKVGVDAQQVSKEKLLQEVYDLWTIALADKENPPLSFKTVILAANAGKSDLLQARETIYSKKGIL